MVRRSLITTVALALAMIVFPGLTGLAGQVGETIIPALTGFVFPHIAPFVDKGLDLIQQAGQARLSLAAMVNDNLMPVAAQAWHTARTAGHICAASWTSKTMHWSLYAALGLALAVEGKHDWKCGSKHEATRKWLHALVDWFLAFLES